MKQTPKQFFSTQEGKLTLAIIAMVFCWTFLIVYLSKTSAGGTWFPSKADMANVQNDISKAMNELSAEEKKLDAFNELKDKYDTSLSTYWNADRDGEPETELRNLVSEAAQNAGANLQTLGSVRTSSINNELSYADLDFTLVDEYDKVIRFFAEVEKCTPRLSWRRVEIRVEPVRARAVTAPGRANTATATTTTTPAQMFRTTGQVRVIKYSPAVASTKTDSSKASARTTGAPAANGKTAAPTQQTSTTTTPATTSTPAAQQPPAPAEAKPASADTPAQKESANPPTNKETEK